MFRIERHRLLKASESLVATVFIAENVSAAVMCIGQIGPELESSVEAGEGLAAPHLIAIDDAEIVVRFGIVGFQPEGLPAGGNGLVQPAQFLQGAPQVGVRFREFGPELDGPAVARNCVSAPALLGEDVAQEIMRRQEAWVEFCHAPQSRFRLGQPSQLRQHDPVVIPGARIVRPLLQRRLQCAGRGGKVSLRVVHVGEHDLGFRKVRLALQGGPEQRLRARQISTRIEQLGEIVVGVDIRGIDH